MAEEPTDEQLMIAYQLGDETAFTILYRRHASRVFAFIQTRVREESAAKDVFQAVFLRLHRFRSKYDPAFPFLPWLFTLCRNSILDSFRVKSRLKENAMEEIPEIASTEVPETLDATQGLLALPAHQKNALELRYGREFSFEEIAVRIGTSPSNARQLVSRAIRFLRGYYGKK